MLDNEQTVGSIKTSAAVRRGCAARSLWLNCRNKDFCKLFPELVELHRTRESERAAKLALSGGVATTKATNRDIKNDITTDLTHVHFPHGVSRQLVGVIVMIVILFMCVWRLREVDNQGQEEL